MFATLREARADEDDDGMPTDLSCCGQYASQQASAIVNSSFPCNLPAYVIAKVVCRGSPAAEICWMLDVCVTMRGAAYAMAWATCVDKPVLYGCDDACPGVHATSCCASCAPGTPSAAEGFYCSNNSCVCTDSGPITPVGRGCGSYRSCGHDLYLGACREGETCQSNVCYAMEPGCDGVPGSGLVDDACGVCGGYGPDVCGVCDGDGSSCGDPWNPGDDPGGDPGDGGDPGGSDGGYCDTFYGDWSWDDCYMDDDCYWSCMVYET